MYWIEMYGSGSDGKPAVDLIGSPFETIDAGAAKARSIGETNTFHRGKAAGYRIRDECKAVVFEGVAESELGVLSSQCLDRRIPDKQTLIDEIAAWEDDRNVNHAKADWQFTTADARIKLKHLYPSI
jgi:hypothetical protein